MAIILSTLEHSRVPLTVREILSFTRAVTEQLTAAVARMPGVRGCVLLSTCNRTELYLSTPEALDPGVLLCRAAEVDYAPFASAFYTCREDEAVRHLLEVAAGLRSRIWGEDQIVTQVRQAIAIARSVHSADPVLETLFRNAIAAGKEVRTRARLSPLPASAASRAVELLEGELGSLAGKRAMVIGNGEMGRLAAALLRDRGCDVTVTLRTYRHGETLVPAGCAVVPYEERFAQMEGQDLLLSATTSPHYTVTVEGMAPLRNPPRYLADLAIPRDIQPELAENPGMKLYNVDDLQGAAPQREVPPLVQEILDRHREEFYRWLNYKDCMPAMEAVKDAIVRRVCTDRSITERMDQEELVELAVGRAVDLLTAGLADTVSPQHLERCAEKIRAHTTGRPVLGQESRETEGGAFSAAAPASGPAPEGETAAEPCPRFPLFLDLTDQPCVVVGGGHIAQRRAETLARCGAKVTVIAPEIGNLPSGVETLRRNYAPGDLAGAFLAVAATDDRAVNRAVGEEARERGIPVSVADRRSECSFFFPALCTGGKLTAGVVSDGTGHHATARAAKAIRSLLEELP